LAGTSTIGHPGRDPGDRRDHAGQRRYRQLQVDVRVTLLPLLTGHGRPLEPTPGDDMDAEHVQPEPSPSRRSMRRKKIQLPVALMIVGIVLVDLAVLGLQGSFSLTIAAPSYGNLTVHCGTLANATSSVPTVRLSNGSRAKLKATGSGAAYVVALEKLKNSCRIAGQLRFDASITAAVLGLAAVFAAFMTSGRIKALAARSRPGPPDRFS
jgi:hypothetical protein